MNLNNIKELILNDVKHYINKINPTKKLKLNNYEKENDNKFYISDRAYIIDIKFDYPELIRIINDKLIRKFGYIIKRYRDGIYEIVKEDL